MKTILFFSLAVLVVSGVGCKEDKCCTNEDREEQESVTCRWGEFERQPLIDRVADGDGDAAYQLADHYLHVERIPEAALFWMKKSHELGNPDADPIVIKTLEENIIFRKAPSGP